MSDVENALYSKEYFLQDYICRFCWAKDAMIECTWKSPLFFKVEYCMNIDLSQDDPGYYPNKVCQECYDKIEQFYDFKTFCHNANDKLYRILNNDLDALAINADLSPTVVKAVKNEITEHTICEESIDGFSNSPQRSELSLQNILESPKSTKESPDNNITCTRQEEKAKPLNKFEENPEKNCITRKKSSKTKTFNKETTKNPIKQSYRRKKCSSYCNICCENFSDQDTFIKHNSEAHGIEKDGRFKCFGCGKLHQSRKARLGHEGQFCKELENGYKCSLCNRYLPKRGAYEKHMRDHRLNKVIELPEDSLFKCNKCMEQFTKKADLKVHFESHAPKKMYVCETCGKVFSRRDYLNKHNVTHTGDKRYVCPHCGFRTTQKNNLTIHIRKHTDERPYSCDLCPQRCVSSSNLRAHRRRHLGLNSFQCTICNKKFGYRLSLKEHIAITHERSQSYPCEHCPSVYARKKGLKRHLLSKHCGIETSKHSGIETGKEKIENTAHNTSVVLYQTDQLLNKYSVVEASKEKMENPAQNTSVVLYKSDNVQETYTNLNDVDKNSEGKVYCIEIKVI
ncbi:hypothetical protein O0L34_g11760 [Tuta absoluta]|nr:hypothetical protein O0L34_g11760 [Tuta absoluta]